MFFLCARELKKNCTKDLFHLSAGIRPNVREIHRVARPMECDGVTILVRFLRVIRDSNPNGELLQIKAIGVVWLEGKGGYVY